MSKQGMKFHKWSEVDEQALEQALDDCAPLFAHFGTQGKSYNEGNAWDAVAGRLLPGVVVTGRACRRRWDEIVERRRIEQERAAEAARAVVDPAVDLTELDDQWERVSRMVDEYEASLTEQHVHELKALHRKIDGLGTYLSRIGRELGLEDWEVWS